jgi:hypothetical protein
MKAMDSVLIVTFLLDSPNKRHCLKEANSAVPFYSPSKVDVFTASLAGRFVKYCSLKLVNLSVPDFVDCQLKILQGSYQKCSQY